MRKRDRYLVRQRDEHNKTQRLMIDRMRPRLRSASKSLLGQGAAYRASGNGGGEVGRRCARAHDSSNASHAGREGRTHGRLGRRHSRTRNADASLPVLPGFEDHPAFSQVYECGGLIAGGRVEKTDRRSGGGGRVRQLSEDAKADYLRKAEEARDSGGEVFCVGVKAG